jgi:uncharacterized membrane protein
MDLDLDFVVSLLSRWIHVGTAIVLVGGTTCLKFVVAPSLQGQSPELMATIRGRWKKFVHAGIALFLITGFFNYFRGMPAHEGDALYHALIGTKIILACVVFFFASVLVGRSPGTQKFRDNSGKWMSVVLVLAALIVAMSGFVKVRGVPAKSAQPDTPSAATQSAAEPAEAE